MANGSRYLVYANLLAFFVYRSHILDLILCHLVSQRARNKLIIEYFSNGYDYSMILILLGVRHGFTLSLRQLKRVLRKYGLRRRANAASTASTAHVEALIRVSVSY